MRNIEKHPQDMVQKVAENFSVSRTTALRHLAQLIKLGHVIKTGTTKQTTYMLTSASQKVGRFGLSPSFEEYSVFSEFLAPQLRQFKANVFTILEYSVTEMLNNAKDHSRGHQVSLEFSLEPECIRVVIHDDGVGIFKNLLQAFHFESPQEVIFELSKGKLTSNPAHHTGEGIFFSSRALDLFTVKANGYCYVRDNLAHDWTFFELDQSHKKEKGTWIELLISPNSERVLRDLFESYQEEEMLDFCKTEILIDLAQQHGERLISRSQAQRVTQRLEKFSQATLDFKKVQAIGQGFADQVFRVYQAQRPGFKFVCVNMNSDVEFMIQRAI